VGEHVIELLDRIDSYRKPAMMGEIFNSLARGDVQLLMFHRLITVVERLPSFEIDQVRRFVGTYDYPAARAGMDEESIQT
jgi:hypothetical protein